MTNFQFWALFGLLVLNLLALSGIHGAVKSLWTKLHELQTMFGRLPADSYHDELKALERQLERIENSIDALRPDHYPDL